MTARLCISKTFEHKADKNSGRELLKYLEEKNIMPYDLSFNNNGFLLSHTGLINNKELNEANGLIHGNENFDSHRYQIIDLLQADFSDISANNANQPAATDLAASRIKSKVKVAIVVQEDNAVNFCKQYIDESKNMGSPWGFELFSDFEDSIRWAET